jgi:hypothetical protein
MIKIQSEFHLQLPFPESLHVCISALIRAPAPIFIWGSGGDMTARVNRAASQMRVDMTPNVSRMGRGTGLFHSGAAQQITQRKEQIS